jgi:hypothetical protein
MNYHDHAKISARKFGGKPEDYIELHELLDSSKYHLPSWQHRAFSHNTWFISIVDKLYGPTIINSDGKEVSVRDILFEHLKEDHSGKVPTIADWAKNIKFEKMEGWENRPDARELSWLKEKQEEKPQ